MLSLFRITDVSAHCDLPCGVYDPAQARIEAESIKAIIAKVADNDDPDFRTRAIIIKEQRSELVKHHLWVLWTDYFKPPHFEKYPELHTLFNEATKLAGASGTKGELDAAKADELLAKIDEIAAHLRGDQEGLTFHWPPATGPPRQLVARRPRQHPASGGGFGSATLTTKTSPTPSSADGTLAGREERRLDVAELEGARRRGQGHPATQAERDARAERAGERAPRGDPEQPEPVGGAVEGLEAGLDRPGPPPTTPLAAGSTMRSSSATLTALLVRPARTTLSEFASTSMPSPRT